MNKVIVLSGVSGSGKSTYANRLGGWIVSADFYFYRGDEYQFDASKLGAAHATCFRNFINVLSGSKSDKELVIVDNTNTTTEEIAPYMLGAAAFGWEAEVHTLHHANGDAIKACADRNIHNVPWKGVVAQAERLARRRLPPYWKQVDVQVSF